MKTDDMLTVPEVMTKLKVSRWNDTPIEPRNFNRAFEAHCRRAGVPTIRVHDTRHTCTSLLADLDVHPRATMRVLRLSQISMTMDVYTQIPLPETRKALDRLIEHVTTDQTV